MESETRPPTSSSDAVGSLASSKFRTPRAVGPTIRRTRLLSVLEASTHNRVVVGGPAGSGKTTVLSDWFAQRTGSALQAWLSLDEWDNDPVRLWKHVLDAAQQASPGWGEEARGALAGGAGILDTVVPLFAEDTNRTEGPVTVVFDDVHLLTGDARRSVLDLAESASGEATVVLLSREGPTGPMVRWIAHDRATYISAEDLLLDEEEADRLVAVYGVDVSATGAELLAATGGWVVPARMLCRALADQPSAQLATLIRQSSIEDYVAEEVLQGVADTPHRDLDLLARLDRFNKTLVHELAPGALPLLGAGRRAQVGLLDLGDGWFALHALIRSAIKDRLPGAADRTALREAADWHMREGDTEVAVLCAVAGGDADLAATLVNQAWPGHVSDGRTESLALMLNEFDTGSVAADPRLLSTSAWLAGFEHDLKRRDALLDGFASLTDPGPLPDGTESLDQAAALNRSLFPSDYDSLQLASETAIKLTGPQSPWRGYALMGAGTASLARGDMSACAEHYLDAATRLEPLFELACVAGAALASALAGEVAAANRLINRSDRLRADLPIQVPMWLAFDTISRAHLHRQEGRLDEAMTLLDEAEYGVRELIEPYPHLIALLEQFECHLALDERAEAVRKLRMAKARADGHDPIGPYFRRLLTDADRRVAQATDFERPIAHSGTAEALTDREWSVLERLVNTHLTQTQIAEEMGVSTNTVKTHAKAIYRKLRVATRDEAAQRGSELLGPYVAHRPRRGSN